MVSFRFSERFSETKVKLLKKGSNVNLQPPHVPAWTKVYTYGGALTKTDQKAGRSLSGEEAAGSRGSLPGPGFLLLPLGTWHVALGYSQA